MPSVIVVGAQWGDEGKGKIVDTLSHEAEYVVRAQGGNNAGHTVRLGSDKCKLRLIPISILCPHTQCYLSAGTVIDPAVLTKEIETLQKHGIATEGRLWISPAAHVVFPYHCAIDRLLEESKGDRAIGTTGRGIGPCYADKANRLGIRIGELTHSGLFPETLKTVLHLKNAELTKLYNTEPFSFEEIYRQYSRYANILAPYVTHVEKNISEAIVSGKNVLLEGAQGTFLDITSGTYPYVTSSSTIAAGICVGAGIGPSDVSHTLGVAKAFTTRVGNGPLPSEVSQAERVLFGKEQEKERNTQTGRTRRIGWFDAVLVKTAARLNGFQSMALTKLDLLDSLETIKICVGYRIGDDLYDQLPHLADDLEHVIPIFESMPGWQTSTTEISCYHDLPQAAQNYLDRISLLCGTPLSMISVCPSLERIIILEDVFSSNKEALCLTP